MSDTPSGIIVPYPASSAPSGWLICDGASLLRADYADLFSAIGTSYGSADGTHFNIPDARGKFLVGLSSAITEFNALGNTGGAKTIDLSHSHTANNHTHTASGNTSTYSGSNHGKNSNTYAANNHYHSISITTGNQSDTGSNSQLSATQSILNPYITQNWIIKV